MATDWTYRIHIIVRVGTQVAANRCAQEIGIGGREQEQPVFDTVRLSSLGHGEPTDLGCSTLMTTAMFDALKAAADAPALGGLRYYCLDAARGTLIESNSPNANELSGSDWQWEDSLTDMGLTRIDEALPPR